MQPLDVMLRERRLTTARSRDNGGRAVKPPSSPGAETWREPRWEERWPRSICGVASALTTCSSMGRLGVWRLVPFFWIRYHCRPIRRWDAKPLVKLSFIHFAQWSLIDRLPGNDGMQDERLRPRYLLFLTNFNGGFDQYIDAFSHVIGFRIRLIWSNGHGFPGPEPATTFKEYIHRQEFPAAHFYSAYPDATATQVQNALEAADSFDAFTKASRDAEPFEFAKDWAALLSEIEPSL